ncbi:hypothetical protein AMR72_02765 [Flavobacterium psychrophilum]|nr:hypothetical protein AMR72_02765 [Flavobacterium psychrophilum]AOE51531.1 hypothetical protein ALW18_02765 [Flavobacterium psychrophilum]
MIVITNPASVANESKIINNLFNEGLKLLHIRKPNATKNDVVSIIKSIKPVHHSKLVLHQEYRLASEFNIRRIHFTEKTRPDFKKITTGLGNKKEWVFSASTHSIETFNKLPDQFAYAFLSPVYESISKSGYVSEVDIIKSVNERTNFKTKLVALGGITNKNINETLMNGFDDIALLGSIWIADNPFKEFKKCFTIYNEFNK